jgi:DNA-binding SARP family transcriptional activator
MDPLLRHAITPPEFDKGKIHRERLVDSIHANIPRKLIVIAAPAGYGKTTLLTDFTGNTELPLCWIRITEADRDLMRLIQVLTASLQTRFRRLKGLIDRDSLIHSEPEGIARLVAEVIEENIGEAFGIVVDDLHLINRSKHVLRFLDAFLDVLPEQVTIIAAGREVPEVSLAKLMADGDLVGFGPHDLALDTEELEALAREQFNLHLEPNETRQMLEETRGWITGVLLSGKLDSGRAGGWLGGSRPMVYEYLASVVLNLQPDDVRRFMLDTSVLPVLTEEACNSLRGADDSEHYLDKLVSEGLFLTAAGGGLGTYEYHPQFREFLLDIMRNADEEHLQDLRRKAAEYLSEQGMVEHAVELFLEAGSTSRAAQLADRQAREMFISGRYETLQKWGQWFTDTDVGAPRLYLYLGTLYSDQGNVDAAQAALDRAVSAFSERSSKELQARAATLDGLIEFHRGNFERVVDAAERAEQILPERGKRWIRASILKLKALALAADPSNLAEAEQLAKQAVELLEETDNYQMLAITQIDLSNYQAAQGKFVEAHGASLRAHGTLEQLGSPILLAGSFNNLAIDAHLAGDYSEGMELFREALKRARLAAAPRVEAGVLYGQADLFNDLGLIIQSAELYAEALRIGTRIESSSLLRYGCVQTSVLHRRHGSESVALDWIKRAIEFTQGSRPPAFVEIQRAALEIQAAPGVALRRLSDLLEENGDSLDVKDSTLANFFRSVAEWVRDDHEAARTSLREALSCAGKHGTEQILAADFAYLPEFSEFAAQGFGSDPTFAVVEQRIEMMSSVASAYQGPLDRADESAEYQLSALGQTMVRRDGELIDALTPFAKELLFCIVDHERIDRDVLAEIFWPGQLPGRQTSNLHTAVYALRTAIGKETIVSEGSVYFINPKSSMNYDVSRFERAAAIAEGLPPGDPRKLFALTEAINSYDGPFLVEFDSEWIAERRRGLEMRFLDIATEYANEALLRDQPTRAVNTLRQALKIDPFRDDLNLSILEALARLGRRGEIISHYQRYVRLLSEELGLDPPKEVREAYARVIG